MLGIPLTVRAIPGVIERWSKARADAIRAAAETKRTSAETEKIEAETAAAALADLRKRLDESERKHENCAREVDALKRQSRADGELLEKLHSKMETDEVESRKRMERDEKLIRGLRTEIDELRRILKAGGLHA